MTQIKLRRDTAANFTLKNPILGVGEPAYETDTKKLKIGDGTTAYTQLEYFSAGGDGSGLEVCDIGMALYVDETKGLRRYLNGQVVERNTNTEAFFTRLQQITTLHPSLLDTEENWQATKTLSPFGQVGKFVFNYSGENIVSVRLPRVVNVQGLFDLQNLGMTVAESLPNITGTGIWGKAGETDASGAIYTIGGNGYTKTELSGQALYNAFDASRSHSTYQDGAPVQQEAIQYPYFIQIATGSETENNIINDIELNNPYSLFDSKYSDHELNNLSWLKSEGQWNAKAVYTTAYDKLLKVYNGTETVAGLSVKLSTETYTDYDFVLNTADETFRLPLKTKLASGKVVVGNGMALGLTNGTKNTGLRWSTSVSLSADVNSYGTNVGGSTGGQSFEKDESLGITTDATKSGIELSDSGLYLYFYIGETVQNANLIDAGRVGEQLANKVDSTNTQWAVNACIPDYSARIDVSSYDSSTNQFTAPVTGWIIGGKATTCLIYINDYDTAERSSSNEIGGINVTLPMSKGDKYYRSGVINRMVFCPAKGAQ